MMSDELLDVDLHIIVRLNSTSNNSSLITHHFPLIFFGKQFEGINPIIPYHFTPIRYYFTPLFSPPKELLII